MKAVETLDVGKTRLRATAVEVLEDALAGVKAGRYLSVMLVLVADDGRFATRWSSMDDRLRTIGALEELKHDIQSEE
jgi:beta-phosphoglucomutase-like phosphatase (HAD superfamily)